MSKQMETNGGKSWLKSVEILARPLRRAAGSKAEAPPLAARPDLGIDPLVYGQSAIFPFLCSIQYTGITKTKSYF